MARESETFEVFTCDGCGNRTAMPEGEGAPIPWFNGHVVHHHAGGGYGADWDACSPAHIRKAVENALAAVD